ncbi:adenosine deaminase [Ruania zhangjianzhongii]|uniref:adenosine deaminase n=1 Tax=Ruania zhangjianzhongii TaxID=2603206 RepID=UPI0011C9E89A|nr:adenosine deaminase [Ruania zhangjianzhongii]
MTTPPCAELHLHLEGTLEPDLVFALAERNKIELDYRDPDELRAAKEFTDLQSFLDLYYSCMQVLRTEEDFADLTRAYLRRAREAGVWHAEIMVDPQAHMVRGVPLPTVIEGVGGALAESEREFGISTGLIAAFLRDRPAAEALEVLDDLLVMDAPLLGIGLDSAEVGYPPSLFTHVYDRARSAGLHLIAHAGEEGPAEYVREALDLLGVERIDHGIRSMDDPDLVQRLVREQVPLTGCPLSNVRLRAVPSLAEHPLPAMLAAGLLVTINSDDPAYFGGYVDDNYAAIAEQFGLGRDQLAALAENSVRASFASEARKTELLGEVETWRVG